MTAGPSSFLRAASFAELRVVAGDDPWVRWGLDPGNAPVLLADGVAVVARTGRRGGTGMWVLPLRPGGGSASEPTPSVAGQGQPGRAVMQERERVVAAVRAVVEDGVLERWGVRAASVPLEHAPAVRAVLPLTDDGGDWEWMWTTESPRVDPRERLLVELDDTADADELREFAHTHNPRVWTRIGEGRVVRWVGVRDGRGDLLAVGGAQLEGPGVAHLAGILTAEDARGQGWGGVVSAALTRWAVRRDGVCTLGMFSDNDAARRVYRRLGYRTARSWHSRHLQL